MRIHQVIVLGSCVVFVSGCDLLKRGKESADSGATTQTESTTSKPTDTTAATTEQAADPTKPPQTGCTWPDTGDHDITITKGCAVTVKNDLHLDNGATLTIEEGVKLSFETDHYLWVEYGKMIVKGTAAAPVTFTSANKSPAAGDWVGIGFKDKTMTGTSLDHLIIEYAGSKSSNGVGAIQLENMRQGGRIAITNTTVRASSQFGLVTDEHGTFSKFENNTFTDCKSGSLDVVADTLGSVGPGNKFNQPIHVKQSTIEQTTTWPPFDVPVFVDGNITVKSDSALPTFTIADKTVVKMGQDQYISVGDSGAAGALVAKNVTFTSGSPAPSPGDWGSIFVFKKTSGTDIEGCTFEDFGSTSSNADGAITLYGTSAKDLHAVTIKNNTFRSGKQQAMHSDDGKCAPFDTQNKVEGIPFCNKP
ncbi:MAG TPA: hypothetical protein VGH28_32780 [Polyangiaceae bacterium]|jgi:hypothetical protein